MCSHSISRQANGIRQELHERSRAAESLKHQIQQIVAGHFLICQRSADGEVLALDVVDERVSGVIPGWAAASAIRLPCGRLSQGHHPWSLGPTLWDLRRSCLEFF